MTSGHGTIATAVEATQPGAFDFLEKPLDADRLIVTVRNAVERAELMGENHRLREVVSQRHAMIGGGEPLRGTRELIARVGPTNARVLITGENGSGKGCRARAARRVCPAGQPAGGTCAASPGG